jgi:hypothetical protein
MNQDDKKPNRLAGEKSQYLLQHAYNPVDWYPWGEEAFERARREDKPIFLSIGYSTCHWCHVMERESFENDATAALMNRYFVCIKVDREERPDVDRIYMAALQGMGQNGGWPMSMFLTPDLKPFFGGTYFPPQPAYGRISFPELLERIHAAWQTQREKILQSATGVTTYLQNLASGITAAKSLDQSILDTCFRQLQKTFDFRHGGFGQGTKFPRPATFSFLLRYYHRTGNADALSMTEKTLEAMSAGGIFDHIGGGFHRYSVDPEWRVPHFEKMLYDQAQIVLSLLDLYVITGRNAYAQTARAVLDYVLRDMTSPSGGFYSAEDADSQRPGEPGEMGEGAFYVWSQKEIDQLLGSDQARVFSFAFGVMPDGNALADPQLEFTGKNILYRARRIDETARHFGLAEEKVAEMLEGCRKRLLQERSARPRPLRDDKIITSWNGLMMSAFARASQVLHDGYYLEAAERSAEFISSVLYDRKTETLKRRYREGEAGLEAHLDDYAFVSAGLIDLYEASFEFRWLDLAARLTKRQIQLFWNTEADGFFDTSGKDPSILVRLREYYDSAEPTGNSIAVMNLLRLADMTDNPDWREMAEGTIEGFGGILTDQPLVMPQMLAAYDYLIGKPAQVILVGAVNDERMSRLREVLFSGFSPNRIALHVEGRDSPLARYLPFVKDLQAIDGKPTAYLCEDYVCKLPTTDPAILADLLKNRTPGK